MRRFESEPAKIAQTSTTRVSKVFFIVNLRVVERRLTKTPRCEIRSKHLKLRIFVCRIDMRDWSIMLVNI